MNSSRRTFRLASRLSVAVYSLAVIGLPSILHDHEHERCGEHASAELGFTSAAPQGDDAAGECSVCHQIATAKTAPGLNAAAVSIEPDDSRRMAGGPVSLPSDSTQNLLPPARAPPTAILS